ncbi:glucosyltransferase domain-containing protein [Atlantibacter subterraneus]|uniref:glucosyltransferase domain-containing protein n=1 Tax=Atlantibacter subterraneus TaxID=255519 RepID=UPI0028ACFE82|nr:glucosyltransferase domain-containing protein [Atlantibacter subterranea]
MSNCEKDKLNDCNLFYKNNKITIIAFLVALVSSLIVYGFEITHFTLSIDEEFKNNIRHTIIRGRWGDAFLKKFILPEPFTPFFTTLFSLCILSITSTITTFSLRLSFPEAVIFSLIYISLPQFAYQLQFSSQADTFSISILACTLGIYYIIHSKNTLKKYILASSLICFATSIYQTAVFYAFTLYISHIAIFSIKEKKLNANMRDMIISIAILCASVLQYFFISYIIRKIYGVAEDSYFAEMIGWNKANVIVTLTNLYYFIINYFINNGPYGLNIYGLSVILVLTIIFKTMKQNISLAAVYFCVFTILILSPFLLNILIGAGMPARTMISLPLAFAVVFTALVKVSQHRMKLYIAAFTILLMGANSSSQLFYTDYIAYKRDYRIASEIIMDLNHQYNYSLAQPINVYFYGAVDLTPIDLHKNSDMFGSSFLNWDNGNSARISAFINATAIANISFVTYSQVSQYQSSIDKAPNWPQKGSIIRVGDFIVVKLGNSPGNCINGLYKNINPERCR